MNTGNSIGNLNYRSYIGNFKLRTIFFFSSLMTELISSGLKFMFPTHLLSESRPSNLTALLFTQISCHRIQFCTDTVVKNLVANTNHDAAKQTFYQFRSPPTKFRTRSPQRRFLFNFLFFSPIVASASESELFLSFCMPWHIH